MFSKNKKSLVLRFVLILVLIAGVFEVIPARANAKTSNKSTSVVDYFNADGISKLDGHISSLPQNIDLPSSATNVVSTAPPEYLVTGSNNSRALFGFSVNSAGDVNGDGFDDVIIGARDYWDFESGEGAAFLYLGSSSGEFSTTAWSVQANQQFASMGGSVDTAGDVNGDGYDDILVGVPQYTLGQQSEGVAFAYYGSISGPSTTPDWTGQIDQASAAYGWSVSEAGDVNNDGYDDVVIGARYYDNGQNNEGKAFLYLGSATGLTSSPVWSKEIDVQDAGFGYSVSEAGDVNGDGFDDILITSYNYIYNQLDGGKAFLFLGEANGLGVTAYWIGESGITLDGYGYKGASAGDVNGDGYSDILVGAPAYDNSGVEGKAYLYLGSALGPNLDPDWLSQDGTTTTGFGASVGSAGDYNHDGYDDIVVGDPNYYLSQTHSIAGAVFLYLGAASGPNTSFYSSYTAGVNNSSFASAVGSAGRFNGDVYDDFLVGSPMWTTTPYSGGRALVFFGHQICTTGPITVQNTNDSGAGSLRQAIADACPGETITFDPSLSGQTITLLSTLDINKNLTIDGSALPSKLSISGNNSVTMLLVNMGITATIDSLIIKNGKSTSNGGGVYNNGGTLTVTNSVFSGNRAEFDPNVVGYGYGGAIYSSTGILTVTGSTFNGNNGSRGGAIGCSGGTMTVTNSTFSTNTASSVSGDGGAIHDNCGTSIENTIFTSNYASHHGGAIFTDNDIDTLTVTNSTFYGNTAIIGGGIANYGGLVVSNSTFSDNNSSNGGAIRAGLGGVLYLRNSILANTVGGVDCIKSESGIIAANINNLIETTGTETDFESCGTPLLSSDPILGVLANNGGPTQTMALLPGSPAINAGDDETCSITDQRGVIRPQGSHCDIGAYEYQGPATPTPTWRPFMKSGILTPASLTTQFGTTSGSLSNLGLLDQSGVDDNPAAYLSFQTPNSLYTGYQSFYLPSDAQTKLVSTMLMQVNVKGSISSSQTWTWSAYDWNTKQWNKLGDSVGVNADQWQTLLFRIRYPWRFSSPVGEIRIQLKSNNANGDAKIDYEAIHITYLSISATPTPVVVPAVTPHRPGISSAPTATPSPTLNP